MPPLSGLESREGKKIAQGGQSHSVASHCSGDTHRSKATKKTQCDLPLQPSSEAPLTCSVLQTPGPSQFLGFAHFLPAVSLSCVCFFCLPLSPSLTPAHVSPQDHVLEVSQVFLASPTLSHFVCFPLDDPIHSFLLANVKRALPVCQAPFMYKKGMVELSG